MCAERRAHESASALPTSNINLVGYLSAISPVLLLQARGSERQAFYAHVTDEPPASLDGRTAEADTIAVLFDGPDAAGWRAFMPSPACELRLCITGLSRTRFETSSLSQRLLVTTQSTIVRTASEDEPLLYNGDGDGGVVGLPRPVMGAGGAGENGRPLLVAYHATVGHYRGDGVWELLRGNRRGGKEEASADDAALLYLEQWSGRILGMRRGASVVVHNGHPVYGRRGHAVHGLAVSVYTSVDILSFSDMDAAACWPSDSCLWRWHWRRMPWDEVTWLMTEVLPQFERKFCGLWSRAKLLAGSGGAAKVEPPLMFTLRSYESAARSQMMQEDADESPRQDLVPDTLQTKKRPGVV